MRFALVCSNSKGVRIPTRLSTRPTLISIKPDQQYNDMIIRYFFIACFALPSAGCGFDPTAPEHDRVRYDELQKADCDQMAQLGSKELIVDKPDDYAVVLERCKQMQALTFEQYQAAAEYARSHGEWNLEAALAQSK